MQQHVSVLYISYLHASEYKMNLVQKLCVFMLFMVVKISTIPIHRCESATKHVINKITHRLVHMTIWIEQRWTTQSVAFIDMAAATKHNALPTTTATNVQLIGYNHVVQTDNNNLAL